MIIDFLPLLPLQKLLGHHHPREEEGRGEAGSSQVSLDLRKADQQRGFYARHLVSSSQTGGGGNPRHGAAETLPLPPKQNWGYDTQFGSRETWQHGEETTEGGATGRAPPRSPEKRGKSLKALIQGAKGSPSSMQPGGGDTLFPRAMDMA